jgi:quaternary ammonium compound-resistance protein SugE
MVWFQLVIAGLLEVVGAVGIKFTDGFTKAGYTALVVVALGGSFYLLSGAATVLPIGTAYAIWTGIGAAGTAIFGMLALKESRNAKRMASLALVVAGSVGMKLFS